MNRGKIDRCKIDRGKIDRCKMGKGKMDRCKWIGQNRQGQNG
jgi:hypothetical protein